MQLAMWTLIGILLGIILNERANRWWIAKKLRIESRDIRIQEIILKRLSNQAQIEEHDILRKEEV